MFPLRRPALSSVCGGALRLFLIAAVTAGVPASAVADEPIAPQDKPIALFNGNDLSGLTTWLKASGREDPGKAFSVVDGVIRVSGEGAGYIATEKEYKDYHLVVEYKWGTRTDGSKYVRNSGVLLNAVGPDGSAGGVWMTSIECQLAQGCEGDLIVIRGKDADGKPVPATITSDTVLGPDKRTRWKAGGEKTVYSGRQFWWSNHDPEFKELLDTRGRFDVASPLGEWTRVECICRGDTIAIKINGQTVNEAYDVFPPAGKILLQNEGNEVYFRKFELHPLPSAE
jgi:hypothetical protein